MTDEEYAAALTALRKTEKAGRLKERLEEEANETSIQKVYAWIIQNREGTVADIARGTKLKSKEAQRAASYLVRKGLFKNQLVEHLAIYSMRNCDE